MTTLCAADVPALVLRGDEDALSSRADTDAMVEALPQGRSVLLPAAGHLSAVETPEPFAAAISTFLADLAEQ
jgi:pimeloyl-ACP methyl ester carboxylesterase